jgi:D-alanyl-D-alanine carboxypeptidase/D-alanyl-D-alanine-endopeptidase (penicillin-binding protein 4)
MKTFIRRFPSEGRCGKPALASWATRTFLRRARTVRGAVSHAASDTLNALRTARAPWRASCLPALIALAVAASAALPMVGQARPPAPGAAANGRKPPALPEAVQLSLTAAGVPADSYAIVVRPVRPGGGLQLAVNDAAPFNPASTIKLLTAHAALSLLGPGYIWRTEVLAAGEQRDETLAGDLVFRGSGDPRLRVEDLWLIVQRLRAAGLRRVAGDVVLDRSAFATISHDDAEFDGEPWRPYNTGADALLVNLKTAAFTFVPDPAGGPVRVLMQPALTGVTPPDTVPALDGPCFDWRGRLQGDFSDPRRPAFRGGFAVACGERTLHVSLLSHVEYFDALFRALWQGAGGQLDGAVRAGTAPPDARRLALHESRPLSELLRDMNKNSNNVMARQIYLTLGREATQAPADPQRAADAVRGWLKQRGMSMPELVLDNGTGLSRIERISAGSLARLLADAYTSATMPEFMASLPLAGVDGTMRSRLAVSGRAHVKTGLLNEVRALAGYVLADSGRRYVVVLLVNHPNAGAAWRTQDLLLEWVRRDG